jgi:hypothetical protein
MFENVLVNLLKQKREYLELKESVYNTSLEKSIRNIIKQINLDLLKILMLNKLDILSN